MLLPTLIFVLFALLSVGGVLWATWELKGRRAALWAAAATLVAYAALGAGVVWLIRQGTGG